MIQFFLLFLLNFGQVIVLVVAAVAFVVVAFLIHLIRLILLKADILKDEDVAEAEALASG